jgi:hypothetical protein
MVNNNQSVSVKLKPESIRDIEIFVDTICDQLFINETYYGNILMALTELFNYLLITKHTGSLNITYNSDYKNVEISFQPIDIQAGNKFSQPVDFEKILDRESDKNIFLINSLVDNINIVGEDTLMFGFDISALHNKIYNKRAALLTEYFTKHINEKVQKEND